VTLHAIPEAPASANNGTEGESSSRERRFWRDPLIWLLLFLALLLRVGYNLVLKQDPLDWYSFVIDEREYFGAAHMLAEGRGFSFFDTALWLRPPLYVALLVACCDLGRTLMCRCLLLSQY